MTEIAIKSESICSPTEHNYEKGREDYYKLDGNRNGFGRTYDQSVGYTMLFCTKCGETKEIRSADQRKSG